MNRSTKIIILPFAGAEAESDAKTADLCRGLAAFVDEQLARLPEIETVLQHLVLSPDDDSSDQQWIVAISPWTLDQLDEMRGHSPLEAQFLLQGSILWHEDLWEVDLQLIDLERRDVVWEGHVGTEPQAFLPRLMCLLAEMAAAFFGTADDGLAVLAKTPTDIPAAFESYLLATSAVASRRIRMPGVSLDDCLNSLLCTIRLDPGFREACERLNGLCMHELRQNDSEVAVDAVIRVLVQAHAKNPDFPLFGATLGIWHATHGDDETALAMLEEYVTSNNTGAHISRGLLGLGTIHHKHGRQGDAVKALTVAVEKDDSNVAAWDLLAIIHLAEGDDMEAERCLRQVLEFDPESASALLRLGEIYWDREDFERAHLFFEHASDASTEFGEATRRFGDSALRRGEYEKADETVTRWAEHDPEDAGPWSLLARLRHASGDADGVAFCLSKLRGRWELDDVVMAMHMDDLARDHPEDLAKLIRVISEPDEVDGDSDNQQVHDHEKSLRELAARYPESLPIWIALSSLLTNVSCWDNAESVQRRVVELVPESGHQWNSLGVIHIYTGNKLEALQAFETAARLAPKDASIHANRGLCLLELGHPEQAEEALRLAVSLGDDNPAVSLALMRIGFQKLGSGEKTRIASTFGEISSRMDAALRRLQDQSEE